MKFNSKKLLRVLLYVFVGALLVYGFTKLTAPYLKGFHNPHLMREWIMSFGSFSAVVYVGLQTFVSIIGVVPGEVMQTVAGFLFGTFEGTLLTLIGLLIGTVITFYIGRMLGEKLLKKIMPKKHFEKVQSLLNKPGSKIVLFVLYLIPGLPKDILGYVSGITPIKIKEFAFICIVARIPSVVISTFLGANLYHRNYKFIGIILVLVALLVVIGLVKKDKLIAYLQKNQTA